MIRHNNLRNSPQNVHPGHPILIQASLSPPRPSPHISYRPLQPTIPTQQPKITFTNNAIKPQQPQSHNMIPFRQLRQKYTRSPSVLDVKQSQRQAVQSKSQQNIKSSEIDKLQPLKEEVENKQQTKQEQVKYSKLKNQFENNQTEKVYVDKKLNITEVRLNKSQSVESKEDKIVNTNNRIQCILEEKQMLEESKGLFSEISYLKKKVNDYEDKNNRLRAELYSLKSKIAQQESSQNQKLHNDQLQLVNEVKQLAAQLKKRQESETDLQREVKQLQIQLRRTRNQWKMATINESEMSKKCQLLSQKCKQQDEQIKQLRQLLQERQDFRNSLPESSVKSQFIPYFPI